MMTACVFELHEKVEPDRFLYRCKNCGRITPPTPSSAENVHAVCSVTAVKITPRVMRVRARLSPVSKLAVVTTYFDPHHSEIRLANYREFIKGMDRHGIEVYTAEGVLAGDSPGLAGEPRCTQYKLHARLWHKERLLNLAIKSLPADVDAVGWFDADITFQKTEKCGCRGGVKGGILQALGASPVVQPWRHVEWLDENGIPKEWAPGKRWAISMAAKNRTLEHRNKPCVIPRWAHPGMAWAARRETLDTIGGLFDTHPLGGSDTMMACGFWGQFNSGYFEQYNQPMIDCWMPWAKRAFDAVKGNVGVVETRITHLYHGTMASRQYADRNRIMRDLGLDPERHLTTAPNGTLTWSPDTPQTIVDFADEYFSRREETPCHSTPIVETANITA